MEKIARVFHSFDEAEEADIQEDRRMTPEQRISIVLELQVRAHPEAAQRGFARVYRIIER